mmetsp:Transcript_87033/g.153929  ORF Transcript_87033/g.153929 Transcript_87033/m.153929 type:complete len:463 (-) Transcript_87033:126-1514(-)|eukprot:CAMPEP_0197641734 /NCGR_PEP_ID=MMETSP1338-20131121/15611_1 /TAXON_ID=43686 ORGANISM="Pelagodinium beii, Strain RCC1491" /NCGR_SAMPLE_ID=MMETSP1338 /ASSEMBLY_ACC=CAM_ASM_000754 /LENGTH=462 /DNA_ID=CAMNT_0043214765 /DNA_START=1 /DNA_END=1389 /DNA_ORIENTATION=+
MGASCSLHHKSNAQLKMALEDCCGEIEFGSPKRVRASQLSDEYSCPRSPAVLTDIAAQDALRGPLSPQPLSPRSPLSPRLNWPLTPRSPDGNDSGESTLRQLYNLFEPRSLFQDTNDDEPSVAKRLEGDPEVKNLNMKLLQVTRAGDERAVMDLLKAKASERCSFGRGQTPLMMAACSLGKGACGCIQVLLKAEAEIESKDRMGWTALLLACRTNKQDQAVLLIEQMANINARIDDGKTAMMLAAVEGSGTFVRYLAKQKASMDKKDERGWTVLHIACRLGHLEVVQFLLQKRMSPMHTAKHGSSPMLVTIKAPEPQNARAVIAHLLRNRASANDKVDDGSTALMLSLKQGKQGIAKFLVDELPQDINFHLDVLAENDAGEHAVGLAERMGFKALALSIEQRRRVQAEELRQAQAEEKQRTEERRIAAKEAKRAEERERKRSERSHLEAFSEREEASPLAGG